MADRLEEIRKEYADLKGFLEGAKKTKTELGREIQKAKLAKKARLESRLAKNSLKLWTEIKNVERRMKKLDNEFKRRSQRSFVSKTSKIKAPSSPPRPPRVTISKRGWVGILVLVILVLAAFFYFVQPGFIFSLGVQLPALIILLFIILFIFNNSFRKFWEGVWKKIKEFFAYLKREHPWVLLILILIGGVFGILYYIGSPLWTMGVSTSINIAQAIQSLRWIIAGVVGVLGLYLIFKKKGEKYPYRKLGIVLLILGVLFGWLYPAVYQSALLTKGFAGLANLRWIGSLLLVGLGVILLFTKSKVLGVFLVILGVAFWFAVPFFSSALFEKYQLESEIAIAEGSYIERFERFWYYVKQPEKYFAKFGRFDNPAKVIKIDTGLKITSFKPVVSTYRSNQDIRLMAEVKNFALPSFTDSKRRDIEDFIPKNVKVGISCSVALKDGKNVSGDIDVRGCGKLDESGTDKHKKIDLPRNINETCFVFCDFKKEEIKVSGDNNETTFKATLNASYDGFITQSVLKTYIIGKERLEVLEFSDNSELEILQELRSAASYPGLVTAERKTTSEYNKGPVRLAVSILNKQPLYEGDDILYTLIVSSKPESIDWEGNILPKSLHLVVPKWFALKQDSKQDSCDFDSSNRYKLKESEAFRLDNCVGQGSCNFFCDFKLSGVEGDNINIEEHNIVAIQVSDYVTKKETTFGVVKVKEREKEKEPAEVVKEEGVSNINLSSGDFIPGGNDSE